MYHFEPTFESDTHTQVEFTLKDEQDQPIDISASAITASNAPVWIGIV